MHRLVEEDENDTITSPTTPNFGVKNDAAPPFWNGFGGDAPSDVPVRRQPDDFPAHYNLGRRTSVSAESLKPVTDNSDNWSPPVHQKTPDQLERLKKAIGGNFLFSHLEDDQSAQVLGALVEKPVPAKGIKVST